MLYQDLTPSQISDEPLINFKLSNSYDPVKASRSLFLYNDISVGGSAPSRIVREPDVSSAHIA